MYIHIYRHVLYTHAYLHTSTLGAHASAHHPYTSIHQHTFITYIGTHVDRSIRAPLCTRFFFVSYRIVFLKIYLLSSQFDRCKRPMGQPEKQRATRSLICIVPHPSNLFCGPGPRATGRGHLIRSNTGKMSWLIRRVCWHLFLVPVAPPAPFWEFDSIKRLDPTTVNNNT